MQHGWVVDVLVVVGGESQVPERLPLEHVIAPAAVSHGHGSIAVRGQINRQLGSSLSASVPGVS